MSTTFPSRCANVSLSVRLPQFECTGDILGNFGNLTDFGRGLGSIPGQLGGIVDCVTADLREQIEQAIETFTSTIRTILKALNISIPDPIFGTLTLPEFEFELRLRELWTNFKFYLFEKLIDILSKIPPLNIIIDLLKVPIPFLEGVYLTDVFTAEGRARIQKAITDKLDSIMAALGMPWDLSFTGKLTLESAGMAVQNIINRIYSEIQKKISNIIWNVLNMIPNSLGRAVKRLWERLGFPLLPAFFVLDFDAIFDSIWQGVVDAFDNAVDRMKAMIERILEFNVLSLLKSILGPFWDIIKSLWTFGTTIKEMLKLSQVEWNLTVPEINFSRIMQAVQDLFNRIPTMIFELWLQLIKPFLDAASRIIAALKPLLDLIPFTFCSFINLAAAPILGIGGLVRDILPPGISIQTFNPPPLLT
jgi:hypothetical protein